MKGIFAAVAMLAGLSANANGEDPRPERLPAPKEVRVIEEGDIVGIFVDGIIG